MEITAIVKRVEETKVVGNNGFEKRDLIVSTEEQYAQTLCIQFVQGKVVELDKFAIGDKVKISINLRGNEFINKAGELTVMNTIQGWRIEKVV
jgi:hypothetical protein